MRTEYMGFWVQPVENMPTIYEIKFQGSGRLAEALQGNFTSPTIAKNTIDLYLKGAHTKKAVKNEASDKVGV